MKRGAAGFTLVEVMLATVLLAGGLALAFASVRSAMAVSQRGEQIAAESERMRAVQALLRRQLAGAMRSPLEVPDPTREPVFFLGEEQRMLFVADLPGYLGRGGPYLHALQVDGKAGQQRLLLDLVLLQEGERIAETPPRPPEVLVGMAAELNRQGFSGQTDGSDRLTLHQTTTLDVDEIARTTVSLESYARGLGASYDGWGAMVVRGEGEGS